LDVVCLNEKLLINSLLSINILSIHEMTFNNTESFLQELRAEITSDDLRIQGGEFNFSFDQGAIIECDRLIFISSSVYFQNLNFCGTMKFISC
jgi:hypothetical protein